MYVVSFVVGSNSAKNCSVNAQCRTNAFCRALCTAEGVSRIERSRKTKNSHRFAVVAEHTNLPAALSTCMHWLFCRSPLHLHIYIPPHIAAKGSILKLRLQIARESAPTLLILVDTFQEHSAETKRAVPK